MRLLADTGAERGGFEPPRPVSQSNGLANRKRLATTFKSANELQDPGLASALHLPYGPGLPPDLAEVSAAWPTLPPAIRAAILAMIRAAGGARGCK